MASKHRKFARAAARRLMTKPAIAKSLRPFCVTCPMAEKSYALRSQLGLQPAAQMPGFPLITLFTNPTGNLYALRRELTWTHWRLLMRVDDAAAHDYYSHDCVAFYAPANAESPNVQRPVAQMAQFHLVTSIAEVDVQTERDRYAAQAFSGGPIAKQAVSQCRRNHAVRLLQI